MSVHKKIEKRRTQLNSRANMFFKNSLQMFLKYPFAKNRKKKKNAKNTFLKLGQRSAP